MFREHDAEARPEECGELSIHERRIVMAMQHIDMVLMCDLRELIPK
jgi:hypothetical protein